MEQSELKTLSCRVPDAVHTRISDLAKREGLTLSEYLRRMVVTALRGQPETHSEISVSDKVLHAAAARLICRVMADIPQDVVVKLAREAVQDAKGEF
jgi:hypothetical protein